MLLEDLGFAGNVVDEIASSGGVARASERSIEEVATRFLALLIEPDRGLGINGRMVDDGCSFGQLGKDVCEELSYGGIVAEVGNNDVAFTSSLDGIVDRFGTILGRAVPGPERMSGGDELVCAAGADDAESKKKSHEWENLFSSDFGKLFGHAGDFFDFLYRRIFARREGHGIAETLEEDAHLEDVRLLTDFRV